jgi:hypothetical protein
MILSLNDFLSTSIWLLSAVTGLKLKYRSMFATISLFFNPLINQNITMVNRSRASIVDIETGYGQSYRLCIELKNWKATNFQQTAVDP